MTTETEAALWSKVAVDCCICGIRLIDATSVNKGIGPVCRKKYRYEDAFPITPEIQNAVTTYIAQHKAIFPDDFVVKLCVALQQPLSRKAANLVVYFASAEQGEAAVHSGALLRALGYVALAERIEERLIAVNIERNAATGQIKVKSPYDPLFVNKMHGIDGAYFSRKDDKSWMLPDTEDTARALFEALKACYPGTFAHGPKGYFTL